MRAAGAGATAAAANGGAIAAAVAATGRGTAVGDRSRGCRRRSGWVRPGLGRAGPHLFVWLPGLCVGPSRREPRQRPSLDRLDARVKPGARCRWGTAAGVETGLAALPHLPFWTKARRSRETPRASFSRPRRPSECSSRAASKLSAFSLAPLVSDRWRKLFPPQVKTFFFVTA